MLVLEYRFFLIQYHEVTLILILDIQFLELVAEVGVVEPLQEPDDPGDQGEINEPGLIKLEIEEDGQQKQKEGERHLLIGLVEDQETAESRHSFLFLLLVKAEL